MAQNRPNAASVRARPARQGRIVVAAAAAAAASGGVCAPRSVALDERRQATSSPSLALAHRRPHTMVAGVVVVAADWRCAEFALRVRVCAKGVRLLWPTATSLEICVRLLLLLLPPLSRRSFWPIDSATGAVDEVHSLAVRFAMARPAHRQARTHRHRHTDRCARVASRNSCGREPRESHLSCRRGRRRTWTRRPSDRRQ